MNTRCGKCRYRRKHKPDTRYSRCEMLMALVQFRRGHAAAERQWPEKFRHQAIKHCDEYRPQSGRSGAGRGCAL